MVSVVFPKANQTEINSPASSVSLAFPVHLVFVRLYSAPHFTKTSNGLNFDQPFAELY